MKNITQKDFLERIPPGEEVNIIDSVEVTQVGFNRDDDLLFSEIELHCDNCNGERYFSPRNDIESLHDGVKDIFLHYVCRNCQKSLKTFAITLTYDKDHQYLTGLKYGEDPSFGPRTPARAITLIGPDRDQFIKGRRCENQGLGIGAFVYYRRVVENQKNRIFDEIIRVSKHLSADPALILEIEAAKNEIQFTKAVDTIRLALPQSLMINGSNPLTLLHSALSAGVHELSDAECLDMAKNVRVVLVEFSERLAMAIKDEKELNEAVTKLANRKK